MTTTARLERLHETAIRVQREHAGRSDGLGRDVVIVARAVQAMLPLARFASDINSSRVRKATISSENLKCFDRLLAELE